VSPAVPGGDPSASSLETLPAARAAGGGWAWVAGAAFSAGLAAGGGAGTLAGRGSLDAQLARVAERLDRVGADVLALRGESKGDLRDLRTDVRELEARLRAIEQRPAVGAGS
jgi:hypothetical protein